VVVIAANEVSYSRPRSVVARLGGPVVAGVGWVGGSDLLSLSLSRFSFSASHLQPKGPKHQLLPWLDLSQPPSKVV